MWGSLLFTITGSLRDSVNTLCKLKVNFAIIFFKENVIKFNTSKYTMLIISKILNFQELLNIYEAKPAESELESNIIDMFKASRNT